MLVVGAFVELPHKVCIVLSNILPDIARVVGSDTTDVSDFASDYGQLLPGPIASAFSLFLSHQEDSFKTESANLRQF